MSKKTIKTSKPKTAKKTAKAFASGKKTVKVFAFGEYITFSAEDGSSGAAENLDHPAKPPWIHFT